jgi:DNA processing protein
LIRRGATLTESIDDILQQLPTLSPSVAHRRPTPAELPASLGSAGAETPAQTVGEPRDSARAQITERLGPTPVAVDELVRQCHLSPAMVVTILLELELAGRLERHPGNQVSLL